MEIQYQLAVSQICNDCSPDLTVQAYGLDWVELEDDNVPGNSDLKLNNTTEEAHVRVEFVAEICMFCLPFVVMVAAKAI